MLSYSPAVLGCVLCGSESPLHKEFQRSHASGIFLFQAQKQMFLDLVTVYITDLDAIYVTTCTNQKSNIFLSNLFPSRMLICPVSYLTSTYNNKHI